ncbi:hypothetical protein GNI_143260 [Gregarina niphandrodes]|uniref:Uncharacterized protein n=1 Tax=Gregarina niphandrodes TaxID=110365 RepID=A0A023B022_GRENI|nr:hypothetical protein GNI_143260 [Gregarina niphandrodes]EZG44826.1 hypothetical protein GNI_143260 [Gregarina niphandrodes]|eukprot:XP_011132650.1 hypothetical protein GNI_143260 [Gregarina niphandrodes]
MDLSLDDLIASRKPEKNKSEKAAKGSAGKTGQSGPKSGAKSTKKDRPVITPTRRSAGVPAVRRTQTPVKNLKIGAPILVSRRLLDGVAKGGVGKRSSTRADDRHGAKQVAKTVPKVVRSPVLRRHSPVRTAERALLSEQDKLQAAKIKVITQLDRVPAPTGAVRQFVEESQQRSGRRITESNRRLSDHFR